MRSVGGYSTAIDGHRRLMCLPLTTLPPDRITNAMRLSFRRHLTLRSNKRRRAAHRTGLFVRVDHFLDRNTLQAANVHKRRREILPDDHAPDATKMLA